MSTAKFSISCQKTNKTVCFQQETRHSALVNVKWRMKMTYRFRNGGEKSTAQLVYEWIVRNNPGFKFSYQEPALALKLPVEKWPNVSAALCMFKKQGAIKVNGSRMLIGPSGRKYPSAVYEFVKQIDRNDHSKPIDHKKNRIKKNKIKKKVLAYGETNERRIKNLIVELLDISVKIESLMLELHKASK